MDSNECFALYDTKSFINLLNTNQYLLHLVPRGLLQMAAKSADQEARKRTKATSVVESSEKSEEKVVHVKRDEKERKKGTEKAENYDDLTSPPSANVDYFAGTQSLLIIVVLILACMVGFSSRLFAVIRFESIIHEFDPWYVLF